MAIEMTVKDPDIATNLIWELNAKRLVGKRVTVAMAAAGYDSDEALSRDTELTVRTVWRLRNGKSYPRRDTAERMAAALGISAEELRPPLHPDDDPELRDQIADFERATFDRLHRIERALGIEESDPVEALELDEEAETSDQSEPSGEPSEEPGLEAGNA
jgi:transcriptional regulator with XRE-family HTH domain